VACCPATAADVADVAPRYSISATTAAESYDCDSPHQETPSLACLLLNTRPLDDYDALRPLLTDETLLPEAPRTESTGGSVSYRVTDRWTAALAYHYDIYLPLSATRELRASPPNRLAQGRNDVLDLQLSWRLSWSHVDVGYRFQSTRTSPTLGQSYFLSRLLERDDPLHAVTIGITRRFGGE
jgi:hypothetical protein